MLFGIIFTWLALAICAIAAPVTEAPATNTSAIRHEEFSLVPVGSDGTTLGEANKFVGGTCKCTIRSFSDAANQIYAIQPPMLKKILAGNLYYSFTGLPKKFYIDGYHNERENFRYDWKSWDQYTAKNGGRCERGNWSGQGLHCARDQKATWRFLDMWCYFQC
ncbi:hypothetical protein K504DRAFT_493680, partial [Pleomassaria siparia CBS 279.74]